MTRLSRFLCLLSVCCLAAPLFADAGLSGKIDISGRQRMLSQRIARAACFIAMDVDVQTNKEILVASRSAFGRTLSELKLGGGAQYFAPETDQAALEHIDQIERLWFPLQAQIAGFTRGTPMDYETLRAFSGEVNSLMEASDRYVEALERKAQASDSGVSPEQARFINLSGRQRMLMQRMGNEACLLTMAAARGEEPEQGHLREAVTLFNETAFQLTFGSSGKQLNAPPTEEILDENAQIWQKWSALEALFRALESEPLSDRELRELSWEVEAMVMELDDIVRLYAAL